MESREEKDLTGTSIIGNWSSLLSGRETHHTAKGFTLIELMVILIFIGIVSVFTIPRFQSVSRLYTVQVFWAPPGAVSTPYPQVDCGWYEKNPGNFVGVRGHLISPNEIRLEVGTLALTRMTTALFNLVVSGLPGSTPNWTTAQAQEEPTEGEIYVKVIGLR